MACIGGHLKVVEYLIPKFGDNKFDMDNDAENCLHKAVQEGHVHLATYLIENCGFDPNLRNVVCAWLFMFMFMCVCACDGVNGHVFYLPVYACVFMCVCACVCYSEYYTHESRRSNEVFLNI